MNEHVLAIDCGTQSLRASLFDARGQLFLEQKIPFPPHLSPWPGWAEQDPEVYWQALGAACRALWQAGADPAGVVGVAVTAQRGTILNLDQAGRPLRPAILWLDRRCTENLPPLGGLFGWLARSVGLGSTLRYIQAETEVNWIAQHQPEIWSKTAHLLMLSGFLNYRLTGEFRDSSASQVGYIPFDYRHHRWEKPGSWKWQIAPFRFEHFPELTSPGALLGHMTQAASWHTGLLPKTPVFAAAGDKSCEVLGAGATQSGVGCISYGTAATFTVTSSIYREPYPFIPAYPAALPSLYSLESQIHRGSWMINWFKKEFGHFEEQAAKLKNVPVEQLLDELLDGVPPGSLGLTLQPYWSPGIREPGPEAKGAIIGFGDIHTKAHLYRAIIEGLVYALRAGKEQLERRTKIPVTSLYAAGGGSRSDRILQITADIFELPVARPHVSEASCLGAAICAAVGAQLHPDFGTALKNMTRVARTFEPQKQNAETYAQLYRAVYQKIYPSLQPLYRRIRKVTNYPPEF